MKLLHHLTGLFLIGFLFIWISCQDEHPDDLPPLRANFLVSDTSGLTTTLFRFDVGAGMDLGDNKNPVFIRFDWEGNGIWDMMHSSLPDYIHRYYQKGLYWATMEVSRVNGDRDTIQKLIQVEQGYSPPQPQLIVSPDSAHLLTDFHFDASLTHDDEDSLETLLFRWDFEGDQIWDTEYSSSPLMSHRYLYPKDYSAVLEVKDTMNLTARLEKRVRVNLLNDLIKPRVNFTCGHCTVEQVFEFDASASYEEGKPESKLLFSWDAFNDNEWEVLGDHNPSWSFQFPEPGSKRVRLRVTAPDGLYMDTVLKVDVYDKNTPPFAYLTVGCRIGNPLTQFYFHSRRSYDRDDSIMDLRIRWDLNNDGVWDPELNDEMNIYRRFTEPGEYIIRMGIIDLGDKESIDVDTIQVFEGNAETDLLIDKRGTFDEYYGIVKIGNQWWMQENFNTEYISKDYSIVKDCYRNDPENCEQYGGLYSYSDKNSPDGLCPKGWRVPKAADWEILMENISGNKIASLQFGGQSGFHIQAAGYFDPYQGFTGFTESTHFWIAENSRTGVPQAWYFNPKQGISQKVMIGKSYKFYVRCIKE